MKSTSGSNKRNPNKQAYHEFEEYIFLPQTIVLACLVACAVAYPYPQPDDGYAPVPVYGQPAPSYEPGPVGRVKMQVTLQAQSKGVGHFEGRF